jgi:hypothetical protein
MSDEILVQNSNEIKNLVDTVNKTNTILSNAVENNLSSSPSNLNPQVQLYFQSVRNKLFLKFIGIDYEGLLQSLHKNKKVK